jgi:hypothetical protein
MKEKLSLQNIMKNLNKEIKGIEGRTMKGMIEAVLPIRHSMDHIPPLVPIDTGNLVNSFFTVTSKGDTPIGTNPSFEGKNADKLASDHAAVKTAITGKAKAEAKKGPVVAFGFSASYAPTVHEEYGRHFQRPGAGAGFFVEAVDRNRSNILNAIRKNAKVK